MPVHESSIAVLDFNFPIPWFYSVAQLHNFMSFQSAAVAVAAALITLL
jgi:hypothetical protein